MSTVGAQRVPESVLPSAVVDVGFNLGAAGLAVRQDAVKTVDEEFGTVGPEDDDGRKLNTFGQGRGVLGNNVVIDL